MASINCGSDPNAGLKDMFVNRTQLRRIREGQCPARRAVFLKPHGIVKATWQIDPSFPQQWRIGVFSHDTLTAWLRFSSDTVPGAPDLKTTLGVGIKLFGVPGKKLLDGEEDSLTADFVLQNHDVFFVDTAKDMCEFTQAGVVNHDYKTYLDAHPVTKKILDEMAKPVSSVLDSNYWSCLPYALGEAFVKYKLSPVTVAGNIGQSDNPNYLSDELEQRMLLHDAQFQFFVQFQSNDAEMPLDRATVAWDENISKSVPVATLTLHKQNIEAPGQEMYGENLSYNPWHTLPEHKPAGSINEARRSVYKASADLRRMNNGIPQCEPVIPRQ